jgi:hypothetical protein
MSLVISQLWIREIFTFDTEFYLTRIDVFYYLPQNKVIPESWSVVIGGKRHFSLIRNEQLAMTPICQPEIRFLLSFPVACLEISVQF